MTGANVLTAQRLTDLTGLAGALASAGLPIDDLGEADRMFFRFADAGETVGYGGLEGQGPDVLLRSVVVDALARKRGYGRRIVAALEREAAALGAVRLHLLTTAASQFFDRQGYAPAGRDAAPAAIAASEQFRSLCPASAAYLVKRIAP